MYKSPGSYLSTVNQNDNRGRYRRHSHYPTHHYSPKNVNILFPFLQVYFVVNADEFQQT